MQHGDAHVQGAPIDFTINNDLTDAHMHHLDSVS